MHVVLDNVWAEDCLGPVRNSLYSSNLVGMGIQGSLTIKYVIDSSRLVCTGEFLTAPGWMEREKGASTELF
jgi:hypothetical protein